MINWGQIIGQAFPFIILLFIGAVLSALLKPSKKRKNYYKYNKKNKKEKENNNEENFNITFETDPDKELEETIEKIKKNLEGKEDKYKPKKERPPYWTEKIYDNLTKNETTNEEKGKEYEKFVGKYFENEGYIVKYNGIENGKKDNSIDLIAIKNNEIIFIQCKNWKENKYKITHKDIKAFIGDTFIFIKENPQYTNYNIKRLFVMSNKILDKSAYAYIKEHNNIINYKIIKLDNKEKIK